MDIVDSVRALLALVATLALIGLAAVGARRLNLLQGSTGGKDRRMRVAERLILDPRRSLVLVTVDGAERLLLLSPTGDRELSSVARGDQS